MPKCFKCCKIIESAGPDDADETIWQMPDGVHFSGGFNYGSSLYDAGVDGIHVEIIICDKCIEWAQNTERMREVGRKNG